MTYADCMDELLASYTQAISNRIALFCAPRGRDDDAVADAQQRVEEARDSLLDMARKWDERDG